MHNDLENLKQLVVELRKVRKLKFHGTYYNFGVRSSNAGNMKIKNSVKNQVGDIHWHRKLSGGCPSSLLFFDDMFTHSEYSCTDFVMLYTDALIYKRNVFAVGRILDTTIKVSDRTVSEY
uniref:Uncharacterized protein n=1 Tax=Glossina austeni TaxID=7395 RepID=A0A1A9V5W0_GLOAU